MDESQSPESYKTYYHQGVKAYQSGQLNEAQIAFKQCIQVAITPNFLTHSARVYLLKILFEQGHYGELLQRIESERQETPEIELVPDLWLLRGLLSYQVGQYDLAEKCYQHVLTLMKQADIPEGESNNSSWKSQVGLAEVYLAQGRQLNAFHALQSAYQEQPKHPYILEQLIRTGFVLKKYQDILPCLRVSHLPSLDMQIIDMIQVVALYYTRHSEVAQTFDFPVLLDFILAHFDSFKSEPFILSLLLEFSTVLLYLGKLQFAATLLLKLTDVFPTNGQIWHNLGYCHFSRQHYEPARIYYKEALQHMPNSVKTHMDLGKLAVMERQVDTACGYFTKVLQLQPNHQEAKQALQQLGFKVPMVIEEPAFSFFFPYSPREDQEGEQILNAYLEEFIPADRVQLSLKGDDMNLCEPIQLSAKERFKDDELIPPIVNTPSVFLEGNTCLLLPSQLQLPDRLRQSLENMGIIPLPLMGKPIADLKMEMRRAWVNRTAGSLTFAPGQLLELLPPPEYQEPITSVTDSLTPSISLCMIIRDEAALIEHCLENTYSYMDEIIVVDTGSVDDTLKKLENYDDLSIFHFEWQNDFSSARNFSIRQATSDWILILDADEYVHPEFVPYLKVHLSTVKPDIDAIVFPIIAIDENGQENLFHSLMVPRLFRNQPDYFFHGMVHERLRSTQKDKLIYQYWRDVPIYHRGYQSLIRQDKDKNRQYLQMMLKALEHADNAQEKVDLCCEIGKSYLESGHVTLARQYFEEGLKVAPPSDQKSLLTLLKALVPILLHQGQAHKALAVLKQAEKQDADLYLLSAWAYRQLENFDMAIASASQALTVFTPPMLEPDRVISQWERFQILLLLAELYERCADKGKARYYMQRTLKERPDLAPLWEMYRKLSQ